MLSFSVHNRCLLCGTTTNELGSICIQCKNNSPVIDSDICSVCGIPLSSELSTCLRCRQSDFSFDSNRSLFQYMNTAKDIFYHYKFKNNRVIGFWYASLLSSIIKLHYPDYILVPSPSRFKKKLKKGWDQVDFISSVLKHKYKIEVNRTLKRTGNKDQKALNWESRMENLKGKITMNNKSNEIINRKILFFDDIFTTGATANECCRVLKLKSPEITKVLTIAID